MKTPDAKSKKLAWIDLISFIMAIVGLLLLSASFTCFMLAEPHFSNPAYSGNLLLGNRLMVPGSILGGLGSFSLFGAAVKRRYDNRGRKDTK